MIIRHGSLRASGKRFGIVVSKFNEFITSRLLSSCVETLEKLGARKERLEIHWVPGALEVPFFCKKLARSGKYDCVIALACVLRGGTFHFECVSNEVTRGVSQAALETGVPIATGIITADDIQQAIDRAGLKAGNKGEHAALAAAEIANLNGQIKNGKGGKKKTARRKSSFRRTVRRKG